MTLADIYWWYAQRDWAVAFILFTLIVCITTLILYWWSHK